MNAPILVLSFAISTVLWFVVKGQNLYTETTVPLKLTESNAIGLPRNLHIDDIRPVKLRLAGATSQIGAILQEPRLTDLVSVDLTGARVDRPNYPLAFISKNLRSLVQGPNSVEVKLEEVISKTVPVKVEPRGKLQDPTSSLSSYPLSESSVTVHGPKSIVDMVAEARAVLQVNQIDPGNPKPQDVPVVCLAEDGRVVDADVKPDHVTITPIVTAAQVDKTVLVSPTIVGTPPPGYIGLRYKVTPEQLQLTGPSSTLVHISDVKTDAIDVTGLTSTKLFKVRIITPRGSTSRVASAFVRYEVARDPALRRAAPKPKPKTTTQQTAILPKETPATAGTP